MLGIEPGLVPYPLCYRSGLPPFFHLVFVLFGLLVFGSPSTLVRDSSSLCANGLGNQGLNQGLKPGQPDAR